MAEREKARERPSHKKPAKGPYIITDTGNIISRKSRLEGTPHIILSGRVVLQPNTILRGDLCPPSDPSRPSSTRTAITIGKYSYLSEGSTLHPPSRISPSTGTVVNIPMRIGEHVFIGERSVVMAASVGDHVFIGNDVVVGNACVIAERVKVLDDCVMPPAMQVPSGVVVGGTPARILGEVGDGWGVAASGTLGEGEWLEGGDLRALIRSVK